MQDEEFRGLKILLYDDNHALSNYCCPLTGVYEDFKRFENEVCRSLGNGVKLCYETPESTSMKIPIENRLVFNEALKFITSQGLCLITKTEEKQKGPWRCRRCMTTNEEINTSCLVCGSTKLQ